MRKKAEIQGITKGVNAFRVKKISLRSKKIILVLVISLAFVLVSLLLGMRKEDIIPFLQSIGIMAVFIIPISLFLGLVYFGVQRYFKEERPEIETRRIFLFTVFLLIVVLLLNVIIMWYRGIPISLMNFEELIIGILCGVIASTIKSGLRSPSIDWNDGIDDDEEVAIEASSQDKAAIDIIGSAEAFEKDKKRMKTKLKRFTNALAFVSAIPTTIILAYFIIYTEYNNLVALVAVSPIFILTSFLHSVLVANYKKGILHSLIKDIFRSKKKRIFHRNELKLFVAASKELRLKKKACAKILRDYLKGKQVAIDIHVDKFCGVSIPE